MNIQYLFSSSQGDIPLEPAQLALPFKMTPTREHPFLTLKDYFDALERFILMEGGKGLLRLLEKELSRTIEADQIKGIRICSEKHGALYHIARVEIRVEIGVDEIFHPFSVIAAVSPEARAHLVRETEVLKSLQSSFDFDYLPNVFYRGDIAQQTDKGKVELSFLLANGSKTTMSGISPSMKRKDATGFVSGIKPKAAALLQTMRPLKYSDRPPGFSPSTMIPGPIARSIPGTMLQGILWSKAGERSSV